MKNFKILLAIIPLLFASNSFASLARSYSWGYEYGNLISNWSFEVEDAGWIAGGGATVDLRKNFSDTAKHGIFVATSSIAVPNGLVTSIVSDLIRVQPGQNYTLSFYYKASSVSGTVEPNIVLHKDRNTDSISSYGTVTSYSNNSNWKLYSASFTPSSSEQYVRIFLCAAVAGSNGGNFEFDDVILEEGTLDTNQINTRRNRISESVGFIDGLGKSLQSQVLLPDGFTSRISGLTFDNLNRPEKQLLSYADSIGKYEYRSTALTEVNNYYDGVLAPNADSIAYSEPVYASELSPRVTKQAAPGGLWKIGSGHEVESGWYFTSNLNIPTNFTDGDSSIFGLYRLDWGIDPDDNYSFSWSDLRGQLVQTAANKIKSPSSNSTDWSVTKYEYYPNGGLKKVITPLDYENSNDDFKQISNYNSQGQLTSSYTKDRGLIKYWYNRSGGLRFSQNEEQRLMNEYTYSDYDALGRVISTGTQIINPMTQDLADKDSIGITGQSGKVERVGHLYTDTTLFGSRTGFPFNEVMPNVTLNFWKDMLACQYSTNADAMISTITSKQKLVVDCFDYDERGRILTQYKYIGAVQDSNRRVQKISYEYDASNKITKMEIFSSPSDTLSQSEQNYSYDNLGRVTEISGLQGYIARYNYFDWGSLKSVHLGGDSAGTTGILITYNYHIQGWITEIKATKVGTNNILYHQFLGYEEKAFDDGSVPTLSDTSFSGKITQSLYKLAGQDYPTRVFNHKYDELGRMLEAGYQRSLVLNPINANDPISSPVDAFFDADDQDSRLEYDINGRITKKWTAGIDSVNAGVFEYQNASYKIERITGSISTDSTRNLADSGTFDYDSRGALVEDKSQNLKLEYGWDIMPVKITSTSFVDTTAVYVYNLYGPDGQRTTRVTLLGPASKKDEIVVGKQGFDDADIFDVATLDLALAELQSRLDIMSVGEVPGRFLIYVVVDTSGTLIEPTSDSIVQLVKDDTILVDLEIEGIVKGSPDYDSLVAHKEPKRTASTQYFDDDKELHEVYLTGGTYLHTVSITGLFGRVAKIGRVLSNGDYEFYVKNHIGSTVRLADKDGNTLSKDVYDYFSYGEHNYVTDNAEEVEVTEKFTGKELEKNFQAYYFGARFFDPLLGIWLAPDPANQFMNPYGYGGDPVNGVDPNGEELISAIIVGALVGAAISGGIKMTSNAIRGNAWHSGLLEEMFVGAVVGGISGGFANFAPIIGEGNTFAARYGDKIWHATKSGFTSGLGGYSANVFARNDFKNLNNYDPFDAVIMAGLGAGISAGIVSVGSYYDFQIYGKKDEAGRISQLRKDFNNDKNLEFVDYIEGNKPGKTLPNGDIQLHKGYLNNRGVMHSVYAQELQHRADLTAHLRSHADFDTWGRNRKLIGGNSIVFSDKHPTLTPTQQKLQNFQEFRGYMAEVNRFKNPLRLRIDAASVINRTETTNLYGVGYAEWSNPVRANASPMALWMNLLY